MRHAMFVLFLVPLLTTPLLGQSGSQIINDGATEEVVQADPNQDRNASVTICKSEEAPDTTVTVREVDAQGNTVQTWVLSGDGDGTGSFVLEKGHSVGVEDTDANGDSNDARVCFDVQ